MKSLFRELLICYCVALFDLTIIVAAVLAFIALSGNIDGYLSVRPGH